MVGARGSDRRPAASSQSSEPIRVQRRPSATGVIVVCGQKIALGRVHARQTGARQGHGKRTQAKLNERLQGSLDEGA
jgi:hypothetical protein